MFSAGVIMKSFKRVMQWLAVMALSWGTTACSDKSDVANTTTLNSSLTDKIVLDVYKSPTCGCCENWVYHVEASDFETVLHHPVHLKKLKADYGIAPRYQSCHTAISQDGFVFEGHVPADLIQRFLANPPAGAIGLAVPGMPVGSPGMEMGNRFDDYQVLLLSMDGAATVYESISGKR
jgi:hypothetical protein